MNCTIPVLGLYYFYLTYPQSITNPIPLIVTDVSATFVEKTTFLTSSGGGSNTIYCSSVIYAPYNGRIIIPGTITPFYFNLSNSK